MKKIVWSTRMPLCAALPLVGMLACSQSTGGGGSTGGNRSGGTIGAGGVSVGTGGSAHAGGTSGSGGAAGAGSGGAVIAGGASGFAGNGASSGGTSSATGGAGQGGASGAGGSSATGGSSGGGVGSGGHGAGTGGAAAGGAGGSGPIVCPTGKPTEGKKTLTVGTTSRSYYLHVPSAYDGSKPVPLVVDFHGLGGNGTGEAGSNPYKPVLDPEGVISAYPDGVNGTNGTGWNIGPCCTNVDDAAFAKALVQDVQKMACIDPQHVYAVGFSLGGGMVHVLGCKAADVFAAISPAASDLVKETVDSCKPARPLTVIAFRGTADTAVAYGGGSMGSFTNIGAKASFQKWAELNQCTGAPSAEDSHGCSTYSSCAGGVQVTLCTKQGGGHEPGNATVSWPVLKKYALP